MYKLVQTCANLRHINKTKMDPQQLQNATRPLFVPFYAAYLIFERPTLTPNQSIIIDVMFIATSLNPELPFYHVVLQKWAELILTILLENDLSHLQNLHDLVMEGTMYNHPTQCKQFWAEFFKQTATPASVAQLMSFPKLMMTQCNDAIASLKTQLAEPLPPFVMYQLRQGPDSAGIYNPRNPVAFEEHLRDDTSFSPDDKRRIKSSLQSAVNTARANTSQYDKAKELLNMEAIMQSIERKRTQIPNLEYNIQKVELDGAVMLYKVVRISQGLFPEIKVMRDEIVRCATHIAQLTVNNIPERNQQLHAYFQHIRVYLVYPPQADHCELEFIDDVVQNDRLRKAVAPIASILKVEDDNVKVVKFDDNIRMTWIPLTADVQSTVFGGIIDSRIVEQVKMNCKDGLDGLIDAFKTFPAFQKQYNDTTFVGAAAIPSQPSTPVSAVSTPSVAGLQPSTPVSAVSTPSVAGLQPSTPVSAVSTPSVAGSQPSTPGSSVAGSQPSTPGLSYMRHLLQQDVPETPRPSFDPFSPGSSPARPGGSKKPRAKRSAHKRSAHKRSSHKHKRSAHKRSSHKHKRSAHKRSAHKRSAHKRSSHKHK